MGNICFGTNAEWPGERYARPRAESISAALARPATKPAQPTTTNFPTIFPRCPVDIRRFFEVMLIFFLRRGHEPPDRAGQGARPHAARARGPQSVREKRSCCWRHARCPTVCAAPEHVARPSETVARRCVGLDEISTLTRARPIYAMSCCFFSFSFRSFRNVSRLETTLNYSVPGPGETVRGRRSSPGRRTKEPRVPRVAPRAGIGPVYRPLRDRASINKHDPTDGRTDARERTTRSPQRPRP